MLSVECKKIPKPLEVNGFYTHKNDFENLWAVFNEYGLDDTTQEVILFWLKTHYKKWWAKPLSLMAPKMLIMVCPKGTYESTVIEKWEPGQSIADLSETVNAEICFLDKVMQK